MKQKIIFWGLLVVFFMPLRAQNMPDTDTVAATLVRQYCDSLTVLLPQPFSQDVFAEAQSAFETRFFRLENPLVDVFFKQHWDSQTSEVRREPWLKLFEKTLTCPAIQTYLANGETELPSAGVIAFEQKVCQCLDTMTDLTQRDLEKMLENTGSSAATQAKITACNNLYLNEYMTYLQKTYRNPQESKMTRDTRLGVAYMMSHSQKFVQAQAAVRVRAVLPPLQQAHILRLLQGLSPQPKPSQVRRKPIKKG